MKPDLPAMFVVSVDLEMSWGTIDRGQPHDAERYVGVRRAVEGALELMEAYEIRATWAVVGHLFLSECASVNGTAHPEIVRPDYEWHAGDWYALDPCSDGRDTPTFYGADLVEAIRSRTPIQEIGSHSFGHIVAGDPGCSEDAFRSDLQAAKAVAAEEEVALWSFVYPRNSIGHLQILEEQGFRAYRSRRPARFAHSAPWARTALTVADTLRPLKGSAVWPARDGGLVGIPQTLLFDPASRRAEILGTWAWSRLLRRRLSHAVRTSSLYHLWFHGYNLASRPHRTRKALKSLFRKARREIDAGRLENLTMGQAADRWIGADPPSR